MQTLIILVSSHALLSASTTTEQAQHSNKRQTMSMQSLRKLVLDGFCGEGSCGRTLNTCILCQLGAKGRNIGKLTGLIFKDFVRIVLGNYRAKPCCELSFGAACVLENVTHVGAEHTEPQIHTSTGNFRAEGTHQCNSFTCWQLEIQGNSRAGVRTSPAIS